MPGKDLGTRVALLALADPKAPTLAELGLCHPDKRPASGKALLAGL